MEAAALGVSIWDVVRDLPKVNQSGVSLKREQVWSRSAIPLHRRRVRAHAGRVAAGASGRSAAAAVLVREIEALATFRDAHAPLYVFLLTLEALALHERFGALDRATVARLHRRAQAILSDHGVRPVTSRLAFLYGELHGIMCRIEAREGEAFCAEWHAALARTKAGAAPIADDPYHDVLRSVAMSMELGLAERAAARLLEAELPGAPTDSIATLRLARCRILRLSGNLTAADALLDETPVEPASPRHAEHLWERACIESVRLGSLEPQARLLRKHPDARDPRRLLQLFLWSHATKARRWMGVPPKASSLRRSAAGALDPVVLRFAQTIERCYRGRSDLRGRLAALGRALEEIDRIAQVDDQLLAWASAARWLHRAKQAELVRLPLTRYRALSRGLTSDAADDVLGLLGDFPDERAGEVVPAPSDFRFARNAAAPSRGQLARGAELSKMGVSMTRVLAGSLAKKALGKDCEALREQTATEYAEIAACYMGRLKGPLMKLGQVMSFYGFDLPPEVASVLSTLQDAAPAVDVEHVLRTIEEDLGAPVAEVFRRFEPEPLAAGSVGQVHAAELHDGTQVVVKVQYPGMREAIENDLSSFALLAPVLRGLMPRWDVHGILREIGDRMIEECDYRLEARNQRDLRALLAGEPGIHVPRVVETHSAERVLTSERVFGETFSQFRARASQRERDVAGETLIRYSVRTCIFAHTFNTDMHPGNLLFTPGTIHFVDFGSVRRWKGGEGSGFERVIEAVLADDVERFGEALLDLELVSEEDRLDYRWAYQALVDNIMRCVAEDRELSFDADTVLRDVQLWLLDHPEAQKIRVPPPLLFSFRLYWGMFAIISALGARSNWHRLALRMIEERQLLRASA